MSPTAEADSSYTLTPERPANDALAALLDEEWSYTTPFRDAALAYLPTKIAAMLQSLGSWLLHTYLELSLEGLPTYRKSECKYRLRAVVSDLDYTAHALAGLHIEFLDPGCSGHDPKIGQRCADAALRVRELADALRRELGRDGRKI